MIQYGILPLHFLMTLSGNSLGCQRS
jgi:hypothetical protein